MSDAILGTDIWYANVVNYTQAAAAGIKFAYIRTFSGAQVDQGSELHRRSFVAAGVECGPYYVWDKTNITTNPASIQAETMMHMAEPFTLIPALDFEKYPRELDLPPREFCINWLGNFYSRLDQIYDGDSLIYMNLDGINHLKPIPDFLLKRKLWLALPNEWTPAGIAPWTIPTIHQYALDVTAPWASSKIDKNGCNVPIEQIRRKPIIVPPVVPPDSTTPRIEALEAKVAALEAYREAAMVSQSAICKRLDLLEAWARSLSLQ